MAVVYNQCLVLAIIWLTVFPTSPKQMFDAKSGNINDEGADFF